MREYITIEQNEKVFQQNWLFSKKRNIIVFWVEINMKKYETDHEKLCRLDMEGRMKNDSRTWFDFFFTEIWRAAVSVHPALWSWAAVHRSPAGRFLRYARLSVLFWIRGLGPPQQFRQKPWFLSFLSVKNSLPASVWPALKESIAQLGETRKYFNRIDFFQKKGI